MANIASTGRFIGPFSFIHSNDASSYAVGLSSTGDIWIGGSSLGPAQGVISHVTVNTPNTSSTAAYTIRVDGNSSTIGIAAGPQVGITPGTYWLGIPFTTHFTFSNSSTSGDAILAFYMG